ncbi:MAG: aminotransferase class I/II-fold pyridoxal phosphate-dependent enzyme [Candidatus Woesearchaeota archaeon]|nr:aminotransferase class I/II-fold pyridoxal phosphate-dependent enzyme [Candidatus Woesearchaeota archaeon]
MARIDNLDVSIIRKMFDLSATMKDPINLSIGIPHFDVPKEVKTAAKDAIDSGQNKYTMSQGLVQLRERIAKKFGTQGITTTAENIIVTAGVAGAVDLFFRVTVGPGDDVLVPDPSYGLYKELIKFTDARCVPIDTYPDFQLTAARIQQAITPNTKVLVINTPNNPTGQVYPKEELQKIAAVAQKHNILILSDEIYEAYVYEGEHCSIGQFYENTITMSGISKCCGATGWRLGYATGPSQIIQNMAKLQQYTYVCAPSHVQHAAITALDADITDIVAQYDANRKLILETLPVDVPPQGALFACLKTPGSATAFSETLREHKVLTVPGPAFSEHDTHLRITFSVAPETLKKGLAIIKGYYDSP